MTLRAVPPEHRINRWASSSPTKHCRPAVPLTNPVSVLQQCRSAAGVWPADALVLSALFRYKVLNALPGDALGYCHSNGNSVQHNDQLVGLYSSAFAAGHGFAVRPDNFERACALFAARRLVRRSALTWQAEYSAPTCDPADPRWRRWVRDAVVFALFDTKSNQSALRGLPGPVPSLSNPWFWASKSSMRALAVEADFSDMVDDIDRCRAPDRPFVAEWLQNNRSRLGRCERTAERGRSHKGRQGTTQGCCWSLESGYLRKRCRCAQTCLNENGRCCTFTHGTADGTRSDRG